MADETTPAAAPDQPAPEPAPGLRPPCDELDPRGMRCMLPLGHEGLHERTYGDALMVFASAEVEHYQRVALGQPNTSSSDLTWSAPSAGTMPPRVVATTELRYGGVDEDSCSEPLGTGVRMRMPTEHGLAAVARETADRLREAKAVTPDWAALGREHGPDGPWARRQAQLAAGRSQHYSAPHFAREHWAMRDEDAPRPWWRRAAHVVWQITLALLFGGALGLAIAAGGIAMHDRPSLAWATIALAASVLVVCEVLPHVNAWRRDRHVDRDYVGGPEDIDFVEEDTP